MNGYFDRRAIKARAKENLKKCYWLAFGVAAIIGSLLGEGNLSVDFPINSTDSGTAVEPTLPIPSALVVGIVLLVLGVVTAVLIVKAYFLDGALEVGRANFFLSATRESAQFSDTLSGFKKNYRNVCKVMFIRTMKLLLWSLFILVPCVLVMAIAIAAREQNAAVMTTIAATCMLLVPFSLVPSIVKGYEYSMMPYLLAEFPDMTSDEAFAASRKLTKGHKGELFLLDLSFIGWTLLGLLCLGVGVMFLEPYIQTAKAQSYAELCRLIAPPQEPQGSELD